MKSVEIISIKIKNEKKNDNNKISYKNVAARELEKTWNIKMPMILIIVDALRMVPKNLEKILGKLDLRGRIEAIQITILLKSL